MTTKDWKAIRFFSPSENWGNPGLMVREFVEELDSFRNHLGQGVIVTCGTQGVHSDGSLHYIGRASDLVIPNLSHYTLFDAAVQALRFGFTGVGLYRDWEYNGKKTGGLHLEKDQGSPTRKLWLCVKENGVQSYLEFSETNLLNLGFMRGNK